MDWQSLGAVASMSTGWKEYQGMFEAAVRAVKRATGITVRKTALSARKLLSGTKKTTWPPLSCWNADNYGYWGRLETHKKAVFWSKRSVFTNLGGKNQRMYRYYEFPQMEENYVKLTNGDVAGVTWENVDKTPEENENSNDENRRRQAPMQMVMHVIADKLLQAGYRLYLDWCDKEAWKAIEAEYDKQEGGARVWNDDVSTATKMVLFTAAMQAPLFIGTVGAAETSDFCEAEERGAKERLVRMRLNDALMQREMNKNHVTLQELGITVTIEDFKTISDSMKKGTETYGKINFFYQPNPEVIAEGLIKHLNTRLELRVPNSGEPNTRSTKQAI